MNKVREAADQWTANAIEACRANQKLAAEEAAGDLCIRCMMSHPCLCDWGRTLPRMRAFYEKNRRTLFRAEPVLNLNWGQKGDGLMDGLYKIASEPFEAEIRRLNRKIAKMSAGE